MASRRVFVVDVDCRLDDAAFERDGLLHDVSANSSYIDEAAILSRDSAEYVEGASGPRS